MKLIAAVIPLSLGFAFAAEAQEPPPAAQLEFVRTIGDLSFKHADTLTHVAEIPGDRLLSAAEDGSARIWDLKTGAELQRFSHGSDDVWNAVLLQDGEHVATCARTVRIWNIATGEMLRELNHDNRAFRLAVIPGGNLLASGHDSSVILIRDWKTGETVKELKYSKDEVYTMVVPAEGRLIASGDDGVIELWDLESGEKLKFFEIEDDPRVTTISLSPDRSRIAVNAGSKLFCFSTDKLEKLWETSVGSSATINTWYRDGKHIAVPTSTQLQKFQASDGERTWSKKMPFGSHRPVAISADGKHLYTGGDEMIYRLAADDGEVVFPEGDDHLRGDLDNAAVSADGKFLYTAGSNQHLHRFDMSSGEALSAWNYGIDIDALGFPHGDAKLLVANDNGSAKLVSPANGEIASEFEIDDFDDFAFAAGGTLVTQDNSVLTTWRDGKKVANFGSADGDYEAIAASADGSVVASVSDDAGGLQLWDPKTGALVRAIGSTVDSPDEVYLFPAGDIALAVDDEQMYAWFRPTLELFEDSDGELQKAIEKLSSDEFLDRERAKRRLLRFGTGIVPALEKLEPEDPEIRLQIAQVLRALRKKLAGDTAHVLGLENDVTDFAAHPDGRHWAAVCGYGHTTQVVLGTVDREKQSFTVLQKLDDPRAPKSVRFSPDGQTLITGNHTASLGVYRFSAEAP